ncbi:MAG TPA: peptidase MA family metallohydrolase [Anaerolineales bacterium]|nr:peptidase MA family metallohydrolase [Anaerolineales bacterium]
MKRKIRWSLLVVALSLASLSFAVRHTQAQTGIELDATASHQFGVQIIFIAQLKSPLQVSQAFIFIQDDAQGRPITFDANGRSEYRLDVNQMVLRPFAFVRWHYRITLADGTTFQSENYFLRYDDNRFAWQRVEAGPLRIFWHQGDDAFGQSMLNTAQAGLASIAQYVPLDLSQPIDIYVYPTQAELPPHLSLGGEIWLAGHANPALGVAVVVIEPGANQKINMEQRIPHELMHVMLYRHLGAGYANLPAWLREGMATQVELYPNPEYERALANAGARNELIPFEDLCASFPAEAGEAFLAYAQAASFIRYLRGLYGSDGLLNLAGIYANGVDCEHGVERAFGVSLAKLELNWRATVLGQSPVRIVLDNLAPYLVLLCLVLSIPLAGLLVKVQRKGKGNERQAYTKR